MATAPPDRLLTADELMEMPDDGHLYELVKGRRVRVPPSASASSLVAMTLAIIAGGFVRLHKLGFCIGEGGGIKLASDPDTVRAPDFAFFSTPRMPVGGFPLRGYGGAPDLAVEVLSPSNRFGDILAKVAEYLAAGVRLVWVVDPAARSVTVFRPGREPEPGDQDADRPAPEREPEAGTEGRRSGADHATHVGARSDGPRATSLAQPARRRAQPERGPRREREEVARDRGPR